MKNLTITGNLGRDAEILNQNGEKTLMFSVGVSESWKDENGVKQTSTDWVTCFKRVSNTKSLQYLKKGVKVLVIGKPFFAINKGNDGKSHLNITINNFNYEIVDFKDVENGN